MDRIGYPLVKVTWFDAESSDEWEDLHGVDRACRPIVTVGHLIEDCEEHIVVAMSLDWHNQKCSMVKTIPNFWIEEVQELVFK